MARIIKNFANIVPATPDFPSGRIKDDDGTGNGTPVDEKVYGDIHMLFDKLFRFFGMESNNLPDNESNGYQLLEAVGMLGTSKYRFDYVVGGDIGSGIISNGNNLLVKQNKLYVSESGVVDKVSVFDLVTGNHLPLEEFGSGVVNNPAGMAFNDEKIYVSDEINDRVRVFDVTNPEAPVHVAAEDMGSGVLTGGPTSVVVDPVANRVYAADGLGSDTDIHVFNLATGANIPGEDIDMSGIRANLNKMIKRGDRMFCCGSSNPVYSVVRISTGAHLGLQEDPTDTNTTSGGNGLLFIGDNFFTCKAGGDVILPGSIGQRKQHDMYEFGSANLTTPLDLERWGSEILVLDNDDNTVKRFKINIEI